jgi:magnesium transporter
MQDYDIIAVPVVGAENELLGIITVDDIIDIMEFEATEDVGELTASRGATDMNVSSFRAARKRAPWIMLLMGLGLITANVIGAFEETLESVVLLSFFIPLVMDAAGNTGTQSLAVMVRTISTGEYQKHGLWRTLGRELGTGVMIGAVSGITIIILILVFYQELWLAFIVGISLLLTLSVATVIGTIMPIIISKLKIDPAVASGPFITTLNDILGLFIYFSIATTLLQI